MEQFRQIGEAVGGIKALMVFQNHLFNQKQCCLLVDMLISGYKTTSQQIKQNLRFEEKNTKWKIIENPLKELLRVYKEAEGYIKRCLETKDYWSKAISLHQNSDCVEFHIHNLLSSIPVVIEAIEMAGQISGCDQDEIQKRKFVYSIKYQKDLRDPRIFQWILGEQYLVSQDFCNRLESVWDEDRWFLLKKLNDTRNSGSLASKRDNRLAEVLFKNLNSSSDNSHGDVLLPSSTFVNSKDYQVRRRFGNGGQYKEIQWLGESFALWHFTGDVDQLIPEVCKELTLSHPNILQVVCGFTDDEKRGCLLVMDLMTRDLATHVKEACGSKKRVPFSLPIKIDLMLQIARGMEYLHSKNICHGELNPSNIFIKSRNRDGFLHAKVSGFGLSQNTQNGPSSSAIIFHAPEVLAEAEDGAGALSSIHTEKSDVYSFGMICFELLTGKVPFEDTHLQGDKMSRNIRAGERPLFPFHSPKYLTNLTKKCWQNEPDLRPSFSSICRILRYAKRFLVMNPEHSHPDAPLPPIDFSDLETGILRNFPSIGNSRSSCVTEIPFQMFAYRVVEREKANMSLREVVNSESGSDGASTSCDENNVRVMDESCTSSPTERRTAPASPDGMIRKLSSSKKSVGYQCRQTVGDAEGEIGETSTYSRRTQQPHEGGFGDIFYSENTKKIRPRLRFRTALMQQLIIARQSLKVKGTTIVFCCDLNVCMAIPIWCKFIDMYYQI